MVAIRLIIAVSCLPLMAAMGCGNRYAYDGDWIGTRGVVVPKGQETPADTTLNRVELQVKGDRYVLFSLSVPYEGPLDFYAKTQQLPIDKMMGLPVKRAGSLPTFTLVWLGNGSVEIKDGGPLDAVLHRKHETP